MWNNEIESYENGRQDYNVSYSGLGFSFIEEFEQQVNYLLVALMKISFLFKEMTLFKITVKKKMKQKELKLF